MRKGIIAFALFVFASTGVAFADLYINPKGDIQLLRVGSGCHAWGSSVRCDPNPATTGAHPRSAYFRLKGNDKVGCDVYGIYSNHNGHAWVARTESWVYSTAHENKINCSQHWVNENTLTVTGTKR
ncbi:MAG: hypothetical protein ACRENA_08770 [Vulcanimicrobiaceae bacterium]